MKSFDSAGWQIIQAEAIAPLTNSGDSSAFAKAGLFQLSAQGQHLSVNGAWPATEWRPGHAQQFLAAAHKTGGHQQGAEQGEFPRTEFNRLVSQGDLTQEEVHFQRSNRDPFLEAVMAPLEQRAAAGGQLLQAKGLAQNIISTVIQQPHDRISATAGRQHDDGTTQLVRQSEGGTLFENFGADQEIRRLFLAELQSFSRSADGSGEVTVLTEPLHQDGAQGGVRLHDEYAGWFLSSAGLGQDQRISARDAGFSCQVAWCRGH